VRQLDSGRVTSFMVDYCQGRNPWSAKAMATSLRALLRYLHVCGHTPTGLVGAVPGVAGWRLASLPRGLDAAVVARLLGSCDRATVVGRRDYAILLVLARLGLRVDGAGTQNRAAAAQNPLYRLIEPQFLQLFSRVLARPGRSDGAQLRSGCSALLPVRRRENLEKHVVHIGERLDVGLTAESG
jgi:hypothetical protein